MNKSKVNSSALDMSSGLLNFEEALPDAIFKAPETSPSQKHMTPFNLGILPNSANTGSKLMKPSDMLRSENFVFSPDIPPSKQTHELIMKNFRIDETDQDGETDNPFGLTARESESQYQPGTTNQITSRKLETKMATVVQNVLTSAADSSSSPGSGISSSFPQVKHPDFRTGQKPTAQAVANGSASNFLITNAKATTGASQS
jgi:hypothetical protein